MTESILIKYDAGQMRLDLPLFFGCSTIPNIRKMFKLLNANAYQNKEAFQILDNFFLLWADRLQRDKQQAFSARAVKRIEKDLTRCEKIAAEYSKIKVIKEI